MNAVKDKAQGAPLNEDDRAFLSDLKRAIKRNVSVSKRNDLFERLDLFLARHGLTEA